MGGLIRFLLGRNPADRDLPNDQVAYGEDGHIWTMRRQQQEIETHDSHQGWRHPSLWNNHFKGRHIAGDTVVDGRNGDSLRTVKYFDEGSVFDWPADPPKGWKT